MYPSVECASRHVIEHALEKLGACAVGR
jgi:hypothetical protein